MSEFRILGAHVDVPIAMAMIQGLAEYERLTHLRGDGS
jgi:hypothetical protein